MTKFIKKSTVYSDSWVVTEDGHRLPNEIYLLNRIQHPFIVNMIEFFENDSYFQLVMEKHGFGMDLFEFIEKTNGVPEPLGANIAKQLVDAVDYLHSKGILHRDIKDENVVLDDQFHAKLIDFGSATYISDKPFKAFCGTFEYCSPEVLKGKILLFIIDQFFSYLNVFFRKSIPRARARGMGDGCHNLRPYFWPQSIRWHRRHFKKCA